MSEERRSSGRSTQRNNDGRGPRTDNRGPRFDGNKNGQRFDPDRKSPRFDGDKKAPRYDADKRGSKPGTDTTATDSRNPADKRPYKNKRTYQDNNPYQDKKPYQDRGPRQDQDRGPRQEKRPYQDKRVRDPRFDENAQDDVVIDNDKLEGRNSVMEALKANRTINKIFVAKGDREGSIRQIVAIAKQQKIIVTEVERNVLDGMSTTMSHQGIIAFVAVKEYVEVSDILKIAEEKGQPPFIIILDEITDPHNLGSVLRTANAVGAHGVIIPKRRAIGLTSSVSKASAGAVEYVPVARVTNIAQTIETLKKNNVWVVGTDSSGEKAFYESDLKGPMALVIGSEGEGIGKLIKEKCDFIVNIPMKGEITSLNASVAAAVVMYEILKQRG